MSSIGTAFITLQGAIFLILLEAPIRFYWWWIFLSLVLISIDFMAGVSPIKDAEVLEDEA